MGQTLSNYDKKPKPGDLIEIFRGMYQHWAVYVGKGFVVHLASSSDVPGASTNSLMSVQTNKAIVKKEKLEDVVGTDRWEINNGLDKKYKPRPVRVIVREALAKVGKELPYSVFRGNCEHFANELRYGISESWQSQVGEAGLIGVAALAVVGLGGAALAGILSEEKENKKTQETCEA